jgi:hypothetical protein
MPLMNKFFGEVGDHPLGTPIEAGRHPFHQRGNLCNPHVTTRPHTTTQLLASPKAAETLASSAWFLTPHSELHRGRGDRSYPN